MIFRLVFFLSLPGALIAAHHMELLFLVVARAVFQCLMKFSLRYRRKGSLARVWLMGILQIIYRLYCEVLALTSLSSSRRHSLTSFPCDRRQNGLKCEQRRFEVIQGVGASIKRFGGCITSSLFTERVFAVWRHDQYFAVHTWQDWRSSLSGHSWRFCYQPNTWLSVRNAPLWRIPLLWLKLDFCFYESFRYFLSRGEIIFRQLVQIICPLGAQPNYAFSVTSLVFYLVGFEMMVRLKCS